jgi:ADP-ribose pyrophosphatase YjhB (NUDIX family)
MRDRSGIQVKAYAFLSNRAGTHHAVWRGSDSAGSEFHRLLGGGIEMGEHSEVAVLREITEELGVTITAPRLLGVLESTFTYNGQPRHEVAFIYAADLPDTEVIPSGGSWFADDGSPIWVEWRPIDDAQHALPLYPEGLSRLTPGAEPDVG